MERFVSPFQFRERRILLNSEVKHFMVDAGKTMRQALGWGSRSACPCVLSRRGFAEPNVVSSFPWCTFQAVLASFPQLGVRLSGGLWVLCLGPVVKLMPLTATLGSIHRCIVAHAGRSVLRHQAEKGHDSEGVRAAGRI